MTNFDHVQRTIDIFEENLETGAPLVTIGELAEYIGYSPHHLNRLFQSLCGEPLGRYMLRRRLSRAAERIRSASELAGDVALRYGWSDYSAFSRAVRKEFGVSPTRLISLAPQDLPLHFRARPVRPPNQRDPLQAPEIITTSPLHATGLVFFMNPNERSFHRPWEMFSANRHKIRGIIGDDTWQFSSWDAQALPEHAGLWIHCAVQTSPEVRQDPMFFSQDIPSQTILRFRHSGPILELATTYRYIWEEYLPNSTYHLSGNREYQHYPKGDETQTIHICIPVR